MKPQPRKRGKFARRVHRPRPLRTTLPWRLQIRRLRAAGIPESEALIITTLAGYGGISAETLIERGHGAQSPETRYAVTKTVDSIYHEAGLIGIHGGPRVGAIAMLIKGVSAWAGYEHSPLAIIDRIDLGAIPAELPPSEEVCFPRNSGLFKLAAQVKRMIFLLATLAGQRGRPAFGSHEIFGALDLDAQGVSPRTLRRRLMRIREIARMPERGIEQYVATVMGDWLQTGGRAFAEDVLALLLAELIGNDPATNPSEGQR